MKTKRFYCFAALFLIINHCNGYNYDTQIQGSGLHDDYSEIDQYDPPIVPDQDKASNELPPTSTFSNEHISSNQHPSSDSDHDNLSLISQAQTPIETQQNTTVTIAVLGRSGSGVSSTIRELIGPNSNCLKPNGTETFQSFLEYTITNIPSPKDGQFYTLRLLDVPGFVDGRSTEDEAKILASLKSYSLSKGYPDFYLALSRFDDNRIDGEHSLFVQFLKRVELFQNVFLNNTIDTNVNGSNVLFLLTRLMSETKTNQRRPQGKMAEFSRIIKTFTNLQTPHTIVVGDNNAVIEYDAKVEGGYCKLPNKQHYPKNIWEALINSPAVEPQTVNLLTSMMNHRETEMKCEIKFVSTEWPYYYDDVGAFSYLLTLKNTTVEQNEINARIHDVFEQTPETHSFEIVQKIALQLRLQNDNITDPQDLPETLPDRASFFQRNRQASAVIPAHLLNKAFKLNMPEYIPRLTVGHGYVVMSDEISPKTPFTADIYEPSSVGYQFPNFVKCRKLFSPETQYFKSYSTSMSDYILERLKYVDFKGKDNITEKNFNGKVKEGFNLQPEESENVATLTAINEHRILTCNLVLDTSQWVLNLEFIEQVESLVPLDVHDRESMNEWNSWFDKWGSHIVTQGYGGGSIHGSVVGSSVKKILESRSKIDETLNAILKYTPLPFNDSGTPAYRLYGGESDSNSENVYNLEDEQRNNIIKNWETSLGSNFIMLTNEFRLEPISTIVKAKLGYEKGDLIEKAIELLLNGKLKFRRKRKSKPNEQNGNNGGTRNQIRPYKQNHRDDSRREDNTSPRISPTGRPSTISPNPPASESVFTYPTIVQGQEILQAQFNGTNEMIDRLKSDLQSQKERNERLHNEELARLQRKKEEQQRRASQRYEDMRRTQAQTSQNRLSSYQIHLNHMQEIQRKEEQSYDDMIIEIQRKKLEDEIAHKMLLEALKQQQREREREEQARKRKCTGWDTINPFCQFG